MFVFHLLQRRGKKQSSKISTEGKAEVVSNKSKQKENGNSKPEDLQPPFDQAEQTKQSISEEKETSEPKDKSGDKLKRKGSKVGTRNIQQSIQKIAVMMSSTLTAVRLITYYLCFFTGLSS